MFSGGFLGLDNIGVFDRSQPLPGGGVLEQADGSAWMAFYCATMLAIALELAIEDPVYEDIASKFFEHFVAISDAMNTSRRRWALERGRWVLLRSGPNGRHDHTAETAFHGGPDSVVRGGSSGRGCYRPPTRIQQTDGLWFLDNRGDLYQQISMMEAAESGGHSHRLLAIPTKERLVRVLGKLLMRVNFSPRSEFVRSRPSTVNTLSRCTGRRSGTVKYDPGESGTGVFGGNSNWRGPIWFPVNYLLIEALERYHHFYGDDFSVECPTGSGQFMTLRQWRGRSIAGFADCFFRMRRGMLPGRVTGTSFQGSALARPHVIQRILSCGYGTRMRRRASDRLDGADCALHAGFVVGKDQRRFVTQYGIQITANATSNK